VAADGTIEVMVPASAKPGEQHKIAVLGADGSLIGWDTTSVVAASSSTAPGSSAPAASSSGGGQGELGITGSPALGGLAGAAVLLVAIGAVAMAAARRRLAA
jgi:hypothetical protein